MSGDHVTLDDKLATIGAVAIDDRSLRRIIKHASKIHAIGLQVPHAQVFALPRAQLAELDPERKLAASLPERVVAFRADRSALAAARDDAGDVWTSTWRIVFHGKIHEAFDARTGDRALTRAAVRERIHKIGETAFDEIRYALRQEDALLPPADDLATYVEFAALFLELKHFAPHSIAQLFPTLHHNTSVAEVLALDIDDRALLAAARPPGAPDAPWTEPPPPPVKTRQPPRREPDPRVRPAATAARAKGNHARAAILSLRAGDEAIARNDLAALVAQLDAAVGDAGDDAHASAAGTAGWIDALMSVARYAASQGRVRFGPGARLLSDLQAACVDAVRDDRIVDVATWASSLGELPIVRALPATREIRIAKRLRGAADKVAHAGLASGDEREQLAAAIHAMCERADHQMRRALRPKLEAALDDVGLVSQELPEQVAREKLVDELLDRATEVGRLTISNLRDALSHNDLKMDDLTAAQLARGDQLLRIDRELSRSLDGVYRRGEVYLRGLQKISSVLFGTRPGRFASLYLLLPAIAAYVCMVGAEHMGGALIHLATGVHLELAYPLETFIAIGVFIWLTMHVAPFRSATVRGARWLGRMLRKLLIDGPRQLWHLPITQRIWRSVVGSYVIKPALAAAVAVVIFDGIARWVIAAIVYALTVVVVSSRIGQLGWEAAVDAMVRSGSQVARRVAPGVIGLILEVFARLLEWFERGLYRAEEFFRFRPGQSRAAVVAKGVFGGVWFLVAYFLRLFVNLMLEPVVNPVKHFPVVTVAAKLILPLSKAIYEALVGPLTAVVGSTFAGALAGFLVFVIPGVAGFLVWELKENWKLYRATRPATLDAVGFGHHGETMTRMLRPAFHSGTIPKLFGKLWRATRKRDERGAAAHREALHHVEETIEKLCARELVATLVHAVRFHARDLRVAEVELASNRIEISIAAPSLGKTAVTIAFEEQSGWIVASVCERGWLAALAADQLAIFELALAGFYKLAAVDIVREQLEAALADGARVAGSTLAYDIARDGLVVWPGPGYQVEVLYDLHSRSLDMTTRGGSHALPPLAGKHAVFASEPIKWTTWTTAWKLLAAGGDVPRVVAGPSIVPSAQATAEAA